MEGLGFSNSSHDDYGKSARSAIGRLGSCSVAVVFSSLFVWSFLVIALASAIVRDGCGSHTPMTQVSAVWIVFGLIVFIMSIVLACAYRIDDGSPSCATGCTRASAVIFILFAIIAFICQMALVTAVVNTCSRTSVFFATFAFELIGEIALVFLGVYLLIF